LKRPILDIGGPSRSGKGSYQVGARRSLGGRRTFVLAFSLYLTFIVLSMVPYIAQQSVETNMDERYEYNLVFNADGNQTHYYVERYNTGVPGTVDLVYTTSTNNLIVDVDNIKVLWIDCRSVYEDEASDVYGINPSDSTNFYMFYFFERDHLSVKVDSPQELELLKFSDAPRPQEVWVDGDKWDEGTGYNFTVIGGIALSEVPSGLTTIDIYFKAPDKSRPNALISASPYVVEVGQDVSFSGGESTDPDGKIVSWVWDFGDGAYGIGKNVVHNYSYEGVFSVILSVKDDDDLLDQDFSDITVIPSDGRPRISPPIPDQEVDEDDPPWCLDLSYHFSDPQDLSINRSWSFTGVDTSICILSLDGEDGKDRDDGPDNLCFAPIPNAWGDQMMTLWLLNDGALVDSQSFWLNISAKNDPPLITGTPSLVIHYDEDYTFDYAPYIDDLDTPLDELTLSATDSLGEQPRVEGFKVTYNYPKSLQGSLVEVTLAVNDGIDTCNDMVLINISDNLIPRLKEELPDIEMNEGQVLTEVFDLDDHFEDPDGDPLSYFSFETRVDVTIQDGNTIDVSSREEWFGEDMVTFRAQDPDGALVEDSIVVTVNYMNDPPRISRVPNLVVHYDEDYRFDLGPYISDPDNETEDLRLSLSDEVFCRVDPLDTTVMIINYPKSFYDMTIPVVVTVSDGMLQDSQLVEVWVTDDHPPGLTQPLPDLTIKEDIVLDHVFNLHDYFYDVDRDVLFYSYGQSKLNIEIEPDGWVNIRSQENWYGVETVTFRAIDPYDAIVEDTIVVTVVPVNDAPVFSELPQQRGNVGDTWFIDLSEYIDDVDDPKSALEVELTGSRGSVELIGLKLIISPETPGESTVVCTVSDGELEDSANLVIFAEDGKTSGGAMKLGGLLLFLVILVVCPLVAFLIISLRRKRDDCAIEAVLLLDEDDGDLNSSRIRNCTLDRDPEITSSLFTTIRYSLSHGDGNELRLGPGDVRIWDTKHVLTRFDLKKSIIVVDKGEHFTLAMVLSRGSDANLRQLIAKVLDDIEDAFPDRMWDQEGMFDTSEDVEVFMDTLFHVMTGEEPREEVFVEDDLDLETAEIDEEVETFLYDDDEAGEWVSTTVASNVNDFIDESSPSRAAHLWEEIRESWSIFDLMEEEDEDELLNWDMAEEGDDDLPIWDPLEEEEDEIPILESMDEEEEDDLPVFEPIEED